MASKKKFRTEISVSSLQSYITSILGSYSTNNVRTSVICSRSLILFYGISVSKQLTESSCSPYNADFIYGASSLLTVISHVGGNNGHNKLWIDIRIVIPECEGELCWPLTMVRLYSPSRTVAVNEQIISEV